MKLVELHGKYGEGKFAIVDDEDYSRVSRFRWRVSNKGYVIRGSAGGVRLHWEIQGFKGGDHSNLDKLDNRKENLRKCSRMQNGYNQEKHSNNTSGFKGVYWYKQSKKWRAQIRYKRKLFVAGYFDSVIEAAIAYNLAAKRLHKEFARPNIIRFCREQANRTRSKCIQST